MWQRAAVAAIAACSILGLAAVAAAAPKPIMEAGHDCGKKGCVSLSFVGTTGNDRLTTLENEPGTLWTASDPSGIVAARGCTQNSETSVGCLRERKLDVIVRLYGGNDSARLKTNLPTKRIDGGPGRDKLVGGRGRDLGLYGGGGGDTISGRTGRDRFSGGPGNDVINAANDDKDLAIDCGPGRDKATVDPQDPRPKGCERVITRRS